MSIPDISTTASSARFSVFVLHSLKVSNYCGIQASSLDFTRSLSLEPCDPTTVIAGDNGLGKTSWLKAITAAIGRLLPGLSPTDIPKLTKDDVHQIIEKIGGIPQLHYHLPLIIAAEATAQARPLVWTRRMDVLSDETSVDEIDAFRRLAADVRAHEYRPLPVLAYYGTQRLWPDLKANTERRKIGNRLDGYHDCLTAASTHEHMLNWMRQFTFAGVQTGKPVVQLGAISAVVVGCVEGATAFGYDIKHEELQLTMKGGMVLPFRLLSDGYRNIVALVADIAWRASILNPQHGEMAPALAEGVVLIDEIDLHLHPKWQRRVLADMRRAFPKLQLITTTHSPFIIQSLKPGQLINLDPDAQDAPYADESPEDIAERIMGVEVPQRSERRRKSAEVAERYYDLLEQVPDADEAELARLKDELDRLLAPYSENQAFVIFLERKRRITEAARG